MFLDGLLGMDIDQPAMFIERFSQLDQRMPVVVSTIEGSTMVVAPGGQIGKIFQTRRTTESIRDFVEKNNPEKDILAVLQHIANKKLAKTFFSRAEMERKLTDSL